MRLWSLVWPFTSCKFAKQSSCKVALVASNLLNLLRKSRRAVLKIRFWQQTVGSIPSPDTKGPTKRQSTCLVGQVWFSKYPLAVLRTRRAEHRLRGPQAPFERPPVRRYPHDTGVRAKYRPACRRRPTALHLARNLRRPARGATYLHTIAPNMGRAVTCPRLLSKKTMRRAHPRLGPGSKAALTPGSDGLDCRRGKSVAA